MKIIYEKLHCRYLCFNHNTENFTCDLGNEIKLTCYDEDIHTHCYK